MKDIMIDLETMGITHDSVITQISVVEFDIKTGEIGDSLDFHIDMKSCEDIGLKLQSSTVLWWLKQSEEAIYRKIEGQENAITIQEALQKLHEFISDRSNYSIWANSPRFDLTKLEYVFSLGNCPLSLPWKFWNEKCVRTFSSLMPEARELVNSPTVAHDSFDDCLYQIEYVVCINKKLNLY